eukprot:TRINITY_DN295_c0_g1_i1.p1 TRINITY_DN295_c0_g1~~TRINITY_DN295_c0_g1_i1.p1  ORF type:complete len:1222 (-),score=339.40 TRINITY_DN295_c0_g1_i1:55-3720(-)
MLRVGFVLSLFLFCCLGQTALPKKAQYTCNFDMSHPSVSKSTTTTGSMKFDWTNKRYQLTFASGNNEIYFFNSAGGFNSSADQFEFSYSGTCPCVTAPLEGSMPTFTYDAGFLTATKVTNQYTPKATGNLVTSVTFGTTGFPVSATFANGRSFTFKGCADSTFAASSWVQPAGCTCGAPQDVVVSWDRSVSITYNLFLQQQKFARALVNGFSYGPLETNLGMVNFHGLTWPGPVMLDEGVSLAAALGGANGLACAPSAQCKPLGSTGTCCGSGTCMSCGIVAGADMLATKAVYSFERRSAAKVLIVFTDGATNRVTKKSGEKPIYDASGNPTYDAGASTSAAAITEDLKWSVAYAKRRVPGVQIYAVGAGSYNKAQLLTVTEGDESRIFATTDWDKLLGLVSGLVAKTCSLTPSPCSSCCGSCACSSWCRNSKALGVQLCEDGNTVNFDGCDATCRLEDGYDCTTGVCIPICGDGRIIGIETCDDGNTKSGDGCSSTCQREDGFSCPTPGKPCTSLCGDGILRASEQCDDGNLVNGDGCSSKCLNETGWVCKTPGSLCTPICGDALVRGDEICDDGNTKSGDGCSSSCRVEDGYTCPIPGKACFDINECFTFGCPDAANPQYPAACLESTTDKKVPVNHRVCVCPPGFVLKGSDQSKLIQNVTLKAGATFVGCQDINECDLYECKDTEHTSISVTCADSTTSSTVPVQFRTCSCPGSGWYVKQSTVTPAPSWITLLNKTEFEGCTHICGDGFLVETEVCDDGNTENDDGCTDTCTVEDGWVCPHPGLKCCKILPKALQPYQDQLDCWNGWWVPLQKDESGAPVPVVFTQGEGGPAYVNTSDSGSDGGDGGSDSGSGGADGGSDGEDSSSGSASGSTTGAGSTSTGSAGTTGSASGSTGSASGSTGSASGSTGSASGSTGSASGSTGSASGSTGSDSSSTGSGSDSGSGSGSEVTPVRTGTNENGDMVLDQDVKLCGPFVWSGTLVMPADVHLTLAGTMVVEQGGNLTFISPDPSAHGDISLIDSCGLPNYSIDITQPQFAMLNGSSFNVNGFDWNLDARVYQSYVFVKHCMDTYESELFIGEAALIPDNAQSFPVISARCLQGEDPTEGEDTEGEDGEDDLPSPTSFEGHDDAPKPAFSNLRPTDLPGGCSDIASFQKSGKNGTDVFVQTNHKDLCNEGVISVATFVPFMLAGTIAVGAAVAVGGVMAAQAVVADDAYVAL